MKVKLGDIIKSAKVHRCGKDQYPVLSMTMHEGIVLQKDRFKKSLASVDQSYYKVVNKGQLVVGFPIDEGVLYIQNVVHQGIMSPAYSVWDVDYEKIDPSYFELSLHSPQAMQFYKGNLRGTTARRRSIPNDVLLQLPINLPSLEEQRKVAAKIGNCEKLISIRNQQLEKMDQLVKSRFIEMFGDPVQNPHKWSTKPLLEMGFCKNGMNFHTGESGIEIHCLGVGDFKDHSVIDGTDNLPIISLNEAPPKERMLQDGDFVFVRSNGNKALVGRCVVIYPYNTPTTYSGFCIRYRLTSSELNTAYLLRVLKTDSMRMKMVGQGANIQNLNQQILSTLNIPIPPIALQNQFADFVAKVDKSKFAGQKALKTYHNLQQSLGQEWMRCQTLDF